MSREQYIPYVLTVTTWDDWLDKAMKRSSAIYESPSCHRTFKIPSSSSIDISAERSRNLPSKVLETSTEAMPNPVQYAKAFALGGMLVNRLGISHMFELKTFFTGSYPFDQVMTVQASDVMVYALRTAERDRKMIDWWSIKKMKVRTGARVYLIRRIAITVPQHFHRL